MAQIKSRLQRSAPISGPETDSTLARLVDAVIQLIDTANGRLSRGEPDDGNGNPRHDNLEGTWVSVTLTDSNDINGGSGGAITLTHNLDLAVIGVPGQSYNYPNVLVSVARVVFGDRTGSNGAPTVPANATHTSVYHRLGDTVTRDTIEVQVSSDLNISATDPLNMDLWVEPAVI